MNYDELKQLINVQPETLLGMFEKAKLKANGKDTFICPVCDQGRKNGKGVCFDPHSGKWHCWGECDTEKNIWDWYMDLRSIGYKEAMHEIADLYGVVLDGAGQGGQLPLQRNKATQNATQGAKRGTVEDKIPPEVTELYSQIIDKSQMRTRTEPEDSTGIRYLFHRGISRDTADYCGVGIVYKGDWDEGSTGNGALERNDSILFPTSRGTFSYRLIDRNADGSQKRFSEKMAVKLKAKNFSGEMAFIECAMQRARENSKAPLFIIEGEFDALSFFEVGCSAVAILGTPNAKRIGEVLTEAGYPHGRKIIVALDNDKAGTQATEEAVRSLIRNGYGAEWVEVADTARLFCDCKDANEALTADRKTFARNAGTEIPILKGKIEEIMTKGQDNMKNDQQQQQQQDQQKPAQEQQQKTPQQLHEEKIMQKIKDAEITAEFIDRLRNPTPEDLKIYPTGFPALDNYLDGGYRKGISILGGMPSTGKTAFIMQLCAKYLQDGEDCYVFNLEMRREDLAYRMVSLFTWQIAQRGEAGTDADMDKASRVDYYAFTQREVKEWGLYKDSMQRKMQACKDGESYLNYTEEQWGIRCAVLELAWQRFRELSAHLHIAERKIEDIYASEVLEVIDRYKKSTGRAPIIFIDYLQKFPPEKDSYRNDTRSMVEDAGNKILGMRNGLEALVFVLSIYSREYYTKPVTPESFKETGSIEFNAEYLAGFHFKHSLLWRYLPEGVGVMFSRQTENNEAKRKVPMDIALTYLKQRGGKPETDFYFNFYGAYSAFEEVEEVNIDNIILQAKGILKARNKGKGKGRGKIACGYTAEPMEDDGEFQI